MVHQREVRVGVDAVGGSPTRGEGGGGRNNWFTNREVRVGVDPPVGGSPTRGEGEGGRSGWSSTFDTFGPSLA